MIRKKIGGTMMESIISTATNQTNAFDWIGGNDEDAIQTGILNGIAYLEQHPNAKPYAVQGIVRRAVIKYHKNYQNMLIEEHIEDLPENDKIVSDYVFEETLKSFIKEDIHYLLSSCLSAKEILVLKCRYGIERDEMKQKEIAKLLGVSGSRIQQIEANALYKLRTSYYSKRIQNGLV